MTEESYRKVESLSESYHLRSLKRGAVSLSIAAQFLRCRGVLFWFQRCDFGTAEKPFFIDYYGAKYARFPPKIAAALKALFRVVENSGFLNRLRNVHLEKSAVTALFHPSCSPTTAKTPAKVHLRLRFQNPGKPRTAGLCG